jgi:hypothetical protein
VNTNCGPIKKKQQRAVLSAGAGNGPAFLGTAPPVMVTDPGRIKQFGNAAADPGLVDDALDILSLCSRYKAPSLSSWAISR